MQRAGGLQCKHRLTIGNLVLIYPCCWCSHGYGCVDGLCRISCLTESGKQRQEGELGFIFIPQPGILTEREEACCLVSFPFCARKSGNFKFPFLPLFTSSFFFLKYCRRNPEMVLPTGFSAKALNTWDKAFLCLLHCKVLAKVAAC